MVEKWVGRIIVCASEADHSILFILPAWRGQVIVVTAVNAAHQGAVLASLVDERDVVAFLESHKPWASCNYNGPW